MMRQYILFSYIILSKERNERTNQHHARFPTAPIHPWSRDILKNKTKHGLHLDTPPLFLTALGLYIPT